MVYRNTVMCVVYVPAILGVELESVSASTGETKQAVEMQSVSHGKWGYVAFISSNLLTCSGFDCVAWWSNSLPYEWIGKNNS